MEPEIKRKCGRPPKVKPEAANVPILKQMADTNIKTIELSGYHGLKPAPKPEHKT